MAVHGQFFFSTLDSEDVHKLSDDTRSLGLIICRGTAVMLTAPESGTEEIENPFLQQEED